MNLAPILAARVEAAFRYLEHHSGLRRMEPDRSTFGTCEDQWIAEAEAERISELATLLIPNKRERLAVLARASLANTWPIRFEVPDFSTPANIQARFQAELQKLRSPRSPAPEGFNGSPQPFRPRAVQYGLTWRGPIAAGGELIIRTERGTRSIHIAVLPPIPDVALKMVLRGPPETAEQVAAAQSKRVAATTLLFRRGEGPPSDAEQVAAALDEAPRATFFFGRWPGDVTAEQVAAALDEAPRTHEHKALATTIAGALRADFLAAATEYDTSALPPVCCAMVLSVLGEVRAELARPMMALDAGQIHHAFVTGTIRAATSEGFHERRSQGRLILAFPDKGNEPDPRLQLELPFTGDAPGQSLINGILRFRSMFGLRNWAALQALFSREGRSGKILWRLSDHLDAMGVSPTWRGRARNRKNVLDEVRALASIELVWEPDSTNRIIAPILQTGHKHATKRGEDWEIDGIELTIHQSLYSGVRGAGGNPGRLYWPVPATLAALDHERFGPALALGLILPMRFRWDQKSAEEGEAPILRLSAATLLETAGVNEHRKGRGHAPRVLRALDTNLRELVRIGVLASATWEKPGDLRSIVVLRPAAASVDRAVRGLRPPADVHPALVAALPATGAKLAAWRKERKLTQGALALALGCSERTIRSAEGAEGERFGRKLAGLLRDRFGTSG